MNTDTKQEQNNGRGIHAYLDRPVKAEHVQAIETAAKVAEIIERTPAKYRQLIFETVRKFEQVEEVDSVDAAAARLRELEAERNAKPQAKRRGWFGKVKSQ